MIFGTVTDTNGTPVTAILELQPTNKGGQILDMQVIASAYGKDNTKNQDVAAGRWAPIALGCNQSWFCR